MTSLTHLASQIMSGSCEIILLAASRDIGIFFNIIGFMVGCLLGWGLRLYLSGVAVSNLGLRYCLFKIAALREISWRSLLLALGYPNVSSVPPTYQTKFSICRHYLEVEGTTRIHAKPDWTFRNNSRYTLFLCRWGCWFAPISWCPMMTQRSKGNLMST